MSKYDQNFKICSNVKVDKIDDTYFLRKSETDDAYLFDGIGATVFFSILKGKSLKETICDLSDDYPDVAELESDVCAFVEDLITEKIIEIK